MLRVSRRHVLIGCALAPFAARAAGRYPDRPIRVIIPYTAGGLAETIMRLLAVSMEPPATLARRKSRVPSPTATKSWLRRPTTLSSTSFC